MFTVPRLFAPRHGHPQSRAAPALAPSTQWPSGSAAAAASPARSAACRPAPGGTRPWTPRRPSRPTTSAAACPPCQAKVAELKSELTDDVSKRVGDVKASLEAEIRDAREKADKAEKSADKAEKEAAKASTFEEPPSDDDGPEKETPPQEEPKKDD